MSHAKFDDDCPGCRPAIMNVHTKEVMSDTSPEMQAINRIWATTTVEQRAAFHRVTCLNSRSFSDMHLVVPLVKQIQAALKGLDETVH
jgi:hypothetical protein